MAIRKPRIRVTKNGPYVVYGKIPLVKMVVEPDEDGYSCRWREVEQYNVPETYTLCRCGCSKNKPFCDGSHFKNSFDGTETASNESHLKQAKVFNGPELDLYDAKALCIGAGFCDRAGNIWNLTTNSDNLEYKKLAIEEAANCPSGRLVMYDKEGNLIEPDFKPKISLTEDQDGIPGPLWVMGRVEIESAKGEIYEVRNRVTLCCCGKSENKPFCDGSHLEE